MKYDEFLGFKVTEEDKSFIEREALTDGLSMSEYARRLLEYGLAEVQGPNFTDYLIQQCGPFYEQDEQIGDLLEHLAAHRMYYSPFHAQLRCISECADNESQSVNLMLELHAQYIEELKRWISQD